MTVVQSSTSETATEGDAAMIRARGLESDSVIARMAQGCCVIEKVQTSPGQPSDFRYVSANPAFERHTALRDLVGRTMRKLVPDGETRIMDVYDEVIETGAARRFEDHVAALDLWIEAEVFPADRPGQIVVLFSGDSARRHAEDALRVSAARQAFLLTLSDALRPLTDAVDRP